MANKHSLSGLLHEAAHRIPGVPAHVEQPAGHQGTASHGRGRAPHPAPHRPWNHSTARPARFMPAWQRLFAAFFGREL